MKVNTFRAMLLELQQGFCDGINQFETRNFKHDDWKKSPTEPLRGEGKTCILEGGEVIEKGGVNFSHIQGDHLPPSAILERTELAGSPFEALGLSIVMHPKNPLVPTSHLNIRLFVARPDQKDPCWWFAGGFDLTPYYPFDEDILYWHEHARNACEPLEKGTYDRFKKACDDYFHLPHRNETRGVGGIFYDNLNTATTQQSFDRLCDFQNGVGQAYKSAYLHILEKRHAQAYTHQQRAFQLFRRGRYVEFNLLYDRGTIFGLQSKGRIESILMSLPNLVSWGYNQPSDADQNHLAEYLKPREWIVDSGSE